MFNVKALLLSLLVPFILAGRPCPDVQHTCSDVANCEFQIDRSFHCVCNPGYDGDGFNCTDIDECMSQKDNCDNVARCTNTPGSFNCTCDSGYTGNGVLCRDIDECQTSPCDGNATCTNLGGSFECSCNPGFAGDGFTCDCAPGFALKGDSCIDMDECQTNPCHSKAACVNTPGSHTCICGKGFAGDGVTDCHCAPGYVPKGSDCVDVDECVKQPCDKNAACTNTIGSFICTCSANYTGSGLSCSVFDYCQLCTSQEVCVETSGVKSCDCRSGYQRVAGKCTDIDECADMEANNIRCSRNGVCYNSPGSYGCFCNAGYTGDGLDCLPLNFFKDGIVG
ncbi:adhesion G protein-coupled receptor E2-like [Watersipora subatra]|uniref:adhesion G protein-coupled receptor E2-like n=1 Tax=Watersipora subatra TaxID=2589382 RepID=UPI00355BBA29